MPINALTVDVEDYYQVGVFQKRLDRSEWASFESRVERNTEQLLEWFEAARGARRRSSVSAGSPRRHPALIRRIAAGGHEVASHGYDHEPVHKMTPESFCEDARQDAPRARETSRERRSSASARRRSRSRRRRSGRSMACSTRGTRTTRASFRSAGPTTGSRARTRAAPRPDARRADRSPSCRSPSRAFLGTRRPGLGRRLLPHVPVRGDAVGLREGQPRRAARRLLPPPLGDRCLAAGPAPQDGRDRMRSATTWG